MNPRPTKRQQDIDTLLTAFDNYFPGVERPQIKFLCAWLYRLPVEGVLDCMERVAAKDAVDPFGTPAAAVWKLVQNESPSDYGAPLRFDENGQRL